MEYQNRLEELLEKFSSDDITEGEFNELCEMVAGSESEAIVKAKLEHDLQNAPVAAIDKSRLDKMLSKVLGQTQGDRDEAPVYVMHEKKRFAWTRVAAVIIFLLVSVGGYFYWDVNDSAKQIAKRESVTPAKNDVAPGKAGAILTLASGKQIVLDDAANGKLSEAAVKNGNAISYLNATQAVVENNTMTTPRGRQFELLLNDGTKVWLNAASSVTYPTAFIGGERRVTVTGEAYFEVAASTNSSKGGEKVPFIVSVNGMEVQVLGTHFNVSAYDDETAIKTTLLEGSVRVVKGATSKLIKPGEQAVFTGGEMKVVPADVDQAVAWKNGLFSLRKTDMQTFLRMIGRWYDVDVVYEGAIPIGTISGKAQRSLSFKQMQEVLQLTDVRFRIEGKKLVVTK